MTPLSLKNKNIYRWKKNYIFWNWNRNQMIKRKHSLQFMGLVYINIWHVEMSFQEEKNSWRQILIIYVSEDMLTKERPPRVYSEYTLNLIQVRRTKTQIVLSNYV